jgi:methylglutaconyl-CoA hydratase
MNYVLLEIKDRIGYITLNRPEKRNALSSALVEELKEAFDTMEASEQVKVVMYPIRSLISNKT